MDDVIVLTGVTKRFSDSVVPLQDVSVRFRAGRSSAIIGASGEGKTTLLNIMGLLDPPSSGSVAVCGKDASKASARAIDRLRSERIGFVFQDSLVDMRRTPLENVELSLSFAGIQRRRRRDIAMSALSRTSIEHRALTPCRYISGGERQRVAIARAIAHTPDVILCDEPTGNLDAGNTERMMDLLLSLVRDGAGVVVVTHDLDVAAACDARFRVRAGTVVAE